MSIISWTSAIHRLQLQCPTASFFVSQNLCNFNMKCMVLCGTHSFHYRAEILRPGLSVVFGGSLPTIMKKCNSLVVISSSYPKKNFSRWQTRTETILASNVFTLTFYQKCVILDKKVIGFWDIRKEGFFPRCEASGHLCKTKACLTSSSIILKAQLHLCTQITEGKRSSVSRIFI